MTSSPDKMSPPSTETEWQRPRQIMKLHRRKKRDSLQRDANLTRPGNHQLLKDSNSTRSKPEKRRNPFSCPSELPISKKYNAQVDNVVDSASEQQETSNGKPALLFDMLESTENVSSGVDSFILRGNDMDPNISTATSAEIHKPESTSACLSQHSLDTESRKEKVLTRWESGVKLPVDWSLKQKCRFMSGQSFSWCSSLRSMDEAEGINIFITKQQTDDEVRREMQFQRSIMYWIHPNLPWVKLFPRYTADNNRVSRASLTTTDEDVLQSLRKDWAESFTSAFHLVRANFSPYFYLCAPQFTVLFLSSRTQGEIIEALVTPTTRGFREALTNEGIEFTLPLFQKQNPDKSTGEALSVDDEEDNSDHTAASVWLESIGLNKSEFPSLDPNKVKIQRECYKAIDNRPQSMVMVQGTNVQAFFNFLLNWRSCVASSGPQTGLPPTILSPGGFKGATIHSLKVKPSMIKQAGENGSMKECGVLELTGPILPHSLSSLCELFKSDCQFSATLNTHNPTTPFNYASESKQKTEIKGHAESELKAEIGIGALKELEYNSNLFHWMI